MKHPPTPITTPGRALPQGATVEPGGVNFSLYSADAEVVNLCLYQENRSEPTETIELTARTGDIRHAFVAGLGPGQQYGYRVEGPYDPARGLRFNSSKLLLDPYAKALTGSPDNADGLLHGYDPEAEERDLARDQRDSGPVLPRCVVVADSFDWGEDRPPGIPWEDLLIYEVHTKGFTAHPSSGVSAPGTFKGFIEKIPHLQSLGVNAVELLPVQQYVSREALIRNGLKEYWGYNSICFFAPEWTYSSGTYPGCQVPEFKSLVRALHQAGIEVILDVVFNHSGEEDHLGPTLCFRGIDNRSYYRLEGPASEPHRYYQNLSGAMNTLDLEHPQMRRLVLDALRYWVVEMHIDGFRFDLAPLLMLTGGQFDPENPLFGAIAEDPVLNRIKLIAEPWSPHEGAQGRFPSGWAEWNDRFRNTIRRFLRGDPGQARELSHRLAGSEDIFGTDRHSINFITCHDGFTMWDLFSYEKKHNQANGEENRDGTDFNCSTNCGVEGETAGQEVLDLRVRLAKNALCCLLFSRGVPMLLGGDELLHTQRGNNNAYCQDNEVSWFNWKPNVQRRRYLSFCRKAITFRRRHQMRNKITWFNDALEQPDWNDPELRTLAFAPGQDLLVILNVDFCAHRFLLPHCKKRLWYRLADTYLDEDFHESGEEIAIDPQDHYWAAERSVVVLRCTGFDKVRG